MSTEALIMCNHTPIPNPGLLDVLRCERKLMRVGTASAYVWRPRDDAVVFFRWKEPVHFEVMLLTVPNPLRRSSVPTSGRRHHPPQDDEQH